MSRQIEPFIRNAVMGDIKRFLSRYYDAPDAEFEPETGVMRASFSPLYVEYLTGIFEDYFEKKQPLQDILEGCFKHDLTTACAACETLQEQNPILFETGDQHVIAETELGKAFFTRRYYDEAIAILDILNAIDEKTKDLHPSEREVQVRDFTKTVNTDLARHLRAKKGIACDQIPEGVPTYNVDYQPVY